MVDAQIGGPPSAALVLVTHCSGVREALSQKSKQWNHCAPAFHVGPSAVEACVHEGEQRTKEDTREVLSGWVGGNFFTHVVPVLDIIIQN